MRAVDTNVLVRILVEDDPEQCGRVQTLLRESEARRERIWVPLPVLLELLWVMRRVYGVAREEVADAVESLLALPVLAFEEEARVVEMVQASRRSGGDLPDLLIGLSARDKGAGPVLTFDRNAAGTEFFEAL